MGKWINNEIYLVEKKEFSGEILDRIDEFAKNVTNETYDRFSYSYEHRVETIRIGKLAEEVFAKFMLDEYKVKLEINYDIYEGINNVDDDDFFINGYKVDIKSSKDTKQEGFENCFSYFNFPVPWDQEIKDVTISIIYSFDLSKFWICRAISKRKYIQNQHYGKLPVGGGVYKAFHLCKLSLGISPKVMIEYILNNPKKS